MVTRLHTRVLTRAQLEPAPNDTFPYPAASTSCCGHSGEEKESAPAPAITTHTEVWDFGVSLTLSEGSRVQTQSLPLLTDMIQCTAGGGASPSTSSQTTVFPPAFSVIKVFDA